MYQIGSYPLEYNFKKIKHMGTSFAIQLNL